MKEATLQILITARALLEQAERHSGLGDRHLATAGLIVLQDAVELVFLAVLIEKEVDEQKAIEKLTFDEMISEIIKVGITVPKSGTLKAMNKLRVTAKHYGQLMEPLTVQAHLNAAKDVIDAVLNAALGRPLRQIFLTELIGTKLARPFLDEAIIAFNNKDYTSALIATRKAFFIEFEKPYCIYGHRTSATGTDLTQGFRSIFAGGWKADYWKKNADWINQNVKTPFDYVQISHETWRIDAMEWGINTQMLNNIQRLTPEAVRLENEMEWQIRLPVAYEANSSNKENAALCIDLTIEAIRRKGEHYKSVRTQREENPYITPTAYIGQPMYQMPRLDCTVQHVLQQGDTYVVKHMLNGFDPRRFFYQIVCNTADGRAIEGFVEKINAQPLSDQEQVVLPPPPLPPPLLQVPPPPLVK